MTCSPPSGLSSYRAFRWPITHPASTLCVALMESDTHAQAGLLSRLFDADDCLGRLTIRLSALEADVAYDSWFPIATPDADDDDDDDDGGGGSGGGGGGVQARASMSAWTRSSSLEASALAPGCAALRLRYSVHFTSARARFVGYLSAPPLHEIPFEAPPGAPTQLRTGAETHFRAAKFACFHDEDLHGAKGASLLCDLRRLQARLTEVQAYGHAARSALLAFEDVLFWRCGTLHLSALLWLGGSLALARPHYIPAALTVCALLTLNRTHAHAHEPHRLLRAPSFGQILCGLLPGGWGAALLMRLEVTATRLQACGHCGGGSPASGRQRSLLLPAVAEGSMIAEQRKIRMQVECVSRARDVNAIAIACD